MKYSTFWQVTPRVKLTVSWNLTVLINFKVWVSSLQMSGWWTRRDKYHSKWSNLLTNGKKTALLSCTLSDKWLTPRSSYTRHWLDHYTEHLNLSESRFEPHWQITGMHANICVYFLSSISLQLNSIYFHVLDLIFLAWLFEEKKSSYCRQRQHLGRLCFRLSFLSISQKLSKVSIWNLEYLFTIKRGTNYNKTDDPVIWISRVICPCFDIHVVHRN